MISRGRFASAALALTLMIATSAPAQEAKVPADYRLGAIALPDPGGAPIGTTSFTAGTPDRPLIVTAWYPAARAGGSRAPYLSPAEQTVQAAGLRRNFVWPAGMLDRIVAVPTHAVDGAPIKSGPLPVVLYNHGFFLYPRQNTALMETLASRGYLVLSLAHPGEAADLPTPGGTIPTEPLDLGKYDMTKLDAFFSGKDDAARRAALPGFWKALEGQRTMVSFARWREDIVALLDMVVAGRGPEGAMPLLRNADPKRIAIAGMSFGGTAAASVCQVDTRCRAAVNLDGFEFDANLYDARYRAPLLLIQSDWKVYPNEGPPNPYFTIYDYAYERWAEAGSAPDLYRYRIPGVKHIGFTDLVLAPHDAVRDTIFGEADGANVVGATDDLVLAFLDRYVAGRGGDLDRAAARHPGVERHRAMPRSSTP